LWWPRYTALPDYFIAVSYTFASCFFEAVKLELSRFEPDVRGCDGFWRAWSVFNEVLGFDRSKVKTGRDLSCHHFPRPRSRLHASLER
jgi:hypothetical protein